MSTAGLLDLSDRTALISGGAGGIGTAVCATLRECGARVLVVDRPGCTLPDGGEAVCCDLEDAAAIAALGGRLADIGASVDTFVHCAGITADHVLWKMPPADWQRVLRVNLDSAFHLLQVVVPHMRRLGHGRVVLISSINGERGKIGQANYAASKAGLIALGRTAARELGRFGVRVNVIAPGLIDTAMTADLDPAVRQRALDDSPLGRAGRPEDVARAVLFLCSELSSHVTGQVLRVDGGQLIA